MSKQQTVDQTQLARLRAAAGAGPVLILMHDNPDSDALAVLFKTAWKLSRSARPRRRTRIDGWRSSTDYWKDGR